MAAYLGREIMISSVKKAPLTPLENSKSHLAQITEPGHNAVILLRVN